ncbi:MAG TPA: TonB family protein [Candidatus Binatia bacterium]|nr:TonB family protein [Candidatus Binatia bacterium]
MEYVSRPLAGFFAASLAIHIAFLLLWSQTSMRRPPQENISVSLLPAAKEEANAPAANQSSSLPPDVPTRSSRSPAIIAKKNSPEVKRSTPAKRVTPPQKTVELKKEQDLRQPEPEPAPMREPPRPPEKEENLSITERRLPTMRELLPPGNWSSANTSGDAAIALNTRDPQYITYFSSIKRNIEFVWEYPEPALRYGLQGKLLLQFTILASGELESAHIIRSSGSNLLDHEALRAMKAAAPFRPIPPWIDKKRLTITASFEYLDNRLNYRVTP